MPIVSNASCIVGVVGVSVSPSGQSIVETRPSQALCFNDEKPSEQ